MADDHSRSDGAERENESIDKQRADDTQVTWSSPPEVVHP
jgi:hypothetical protein